MTTQTTTEITTSEQIVKQLINSWESRNTAFTDFFNKYSDERIYLNEVAPARNRAIYLLGHLISTNDGMLPLFDLGERLFPEMKIFSTQADHSFEITLSISELKKMWQTLNTTLSDHFNNMTINDWMAAHTAVSKEDFEKDPQRNKLNVLIGRTNHQSYHLGQLNLLTLKELVT